MSLSFSKFSILFISIIALTACKKGIIVPFAFNVNQEIVIPSQTGPIGGIPDIITPDVTTNSSAHFEENNTKADLIESLTLSDLELVVKAPEGRTLDFLSSIVIYIKTADLPKKKIAEKASIPADIGDVLVLDPTQNDLADYVKQEKFEIITETTTRKIVSGNTTINCEMRFAVRARVY